MITFQSTIRPIKRCLKCPVTSIGFATSTARFHPSSESEPPTLVKMRADIKNAMRAKDVNRLNALRGFLAAADSASKLESAAMRSESKVLALLSKQAKLSKAAAAEFKLAKRSDLEGKEKAQLAVLEEYISLIHTVPEDEITQTVTKILSTLKANGNRLHYGNVMRDLNGRNGVYAEQPLDMDLVSKIVKEQLQRIQPDKDTSWF